MSPREAQLASIMLMDTTGARCFSCISLANWAWTCSVFRLSPTLKLNWQCRQLQQCSSRLTNVIMGQRTRWEGEVKYINGSAVGASPAGCGRNQGLAQHEGFGHQEAAYHATHAIVRGSSFDLPLHRTHLSGRRWPSVRGRGNFVRFHSSCSCWRGLLGTNDLPLTSPFAKSSKRFSQ